MVNINPEYEYEDFEIDALLRRQVTQLNDPSIIQHAPIGNIPGELRMLLEAEFQRYRLAVVTGNAVAMPQTLLIPLNIGNYHWIGLVIKFDEAHEAQKIYYIDPLAHYTHGRIDRNIRSELHAIYPNIEVATPVVYLQPGPYDCGPITLENLIFAAQHDVEGMPVIQPLSLADVEQIRRQHVEVIEAQYPDNQFAYRQEHNIHMVRRNNRVLIATVDDNPWIKDEIVIKDIIILLDDTLSRKIKDLDDTDQEYNWIDFAENMFNKLQAISWSTKNNAKFKHFPWRQLEFIFSEYPYTEYSDSDVIKSVFTVAGENKTHLQDLKRAFEKLITQDCELTVTDPLLFRRVGAYYLDRLYYTRMRQLWQDLSKSYPAADNLIIWRLAIMRAVQKTGEYLKALTWFSNDSVDELPRKVLIDGRDKLSHLRVTRIDALLQALRQALDPQTDIDSVFKEITNLYQRVIILDTAHANILSASSEPQEKIAKLVELADGKRDVVTNSQLATHLQMIVTSFEIPPAPKLKTVNSVGPNIKQLIKEIVDQLLPLPAMHKLATEFCKHQVDAVTNILLNRVDNDFATFKAKLAFLVSDYKGKLCNDTLLRMLHEQIIAAQSSQRQYVSTLALKLEQLGCISLIKKLRQMFAAGEMSLAVFSEILCEVKNDLPKDKINNAFSEITNKLACAKKQHITSFRKLALSILSRSEKDLQHSEKIIEEALQCIHRRDRLVKLLNQFANLSQNHAEKEMQALYGIFIARINNCLKINFNDCHYFVPNLMFDIFAKLTGFPAYNSNDKQLLRLQQLQTVMQLLELLRETLEIELTPFRHQMNPNVMSQASRLINAHLFHHKKLMDSPQAINYHTDIEHLAAQLETSPLKWLAAEFLLTAISEIFSKELSYYPEISTQVMELIQPTRGHYGHPEATGKAALLMENTTTYIDNAKGLAQHCLMIGVNLHYMLSQVIRRMQYNVLNSRLSTDDDALLKNRTRNQAPNLRRCKSYPSFSH